MKIRHNCQNSQGTQCVWYLLKLGLGAPACMARRQKKIFGATRERDYENQKLQRRSAGGVF